MSVVFLGIWLSAVCSPAISPDRLQSIKDIPPETWEAVARGEKAWPEVLFPLCSISPEEKQKFPATYWENVRQDEHFWETYSNRQRQLFQKEYGPDIHHLYDLYLYDRRCAAGKEKVAEAVREVKTLDRLNDIVAIKAARMPELAGSPTAGLRLFSFKKGALHPVPFDVLEITDKGRIVLPEGPEGNPGDGDDIFNQRDKMVFMAVDAGHRISLADIRRQYPGANTIHEVEISCPTEPGKAWVYAVAFTGTPPPLSPLDYAGIRPETGRVYGLFIFAGCAARQVDDDIVPTHKVLGTFASPLLGAIPVDMLEAFTYKLVIKFRLFGAEMVQGMEDMDVRWRGLYDGRVMIYNRASWKLWTPFGIGAPIIYADLIVTPLSAITYGSVYAPFNPRLVVKCVDLSFGEDLEVYEDDFYHFQFVTMGDRTGVTLDGKMSDKEKALDISGYSWYLLTGSPGTMCIRTEYDEFSTEHASILKLKWQDDAEKNGYTNLFRMSEFDQPTSHFTHEWNLAPHFYHPDPEKYNWDNLNLILKRVDHPLRCRIDGGRPAAQPRYLHLPDIKESHKMYRY